MLGLGHAVTIVGDLFQGGGKRRIRFRFLVIGLCGFLLGRFDFGFPIIQVVIVDFRFP